MMAAFRIVAFLAVQFFTLVGLVIGAAGFLLKAQHSLKKELMEDIKEVRVDVSNLRTEVRSLGQRIARLAGMFLPAPEGLRPQRGA